MNTIKKVIVSLTKIAEEKEDDLFVDGYWLPVAYVEHVSWAGQGMVFPVGTAHGTMEEADTKEKAEKLFNYYGKHYRGKPASNDSLNLIWFKKKVKLPKEGLLFTLKDYLKRYNGKIYSSIGSSLR